MSDYREMSVSEAAAEEDGDEVEVECAFCGEHNAECLIEIPERAITVCYECGVEQRALCCMCGSLGKAGEVLALDYAPPEYRHLQRAMCAACACGWEG